MADPTGYLSAKIAAMIGGFFGGAAILTFIRPKTIGEAFIRGGVSVGSAIIFSGPLLEILKLSTNWDTHLMVGFCTGFLSYSVLGMVANFLIKNEKNDISQAFRNLRNSDSSESPKRRSTDKEKS